MAGTVQHPMGETPEEAISRYGLWPWFFQRLTAVLLVVTLGAHMWYLHFADSGERLTFQAMRGRLASRVILPLDAALLGLALFHGLNGVRMVALDFNIGPRAERWLTVVLWALGLLTFVFGLNVLAAFVFGRPWFSR